MNPGASTWESYEVWSSLPRGRETRLYFGLTKAEAKKTLKLVEADRSSNFPNLPIEYYLVRVTRERL